MRTTPEGVRSMDRLAIRQLLDALARVVQVLGGRGYMRTTAAERLWRELRVDRIWEGTSEIQRRLVANGLVKRGGERMLAGDTAPDETVE